MPEDKENLFAEFPPVTKEEWKEQIEKDLKGRSVDTLEWKPFEGFTVEPFYTGEDLDKLAYLTEPAPGEFPYVRSTGGADNDWNINEYISDSDIHSANKAALDSLAIGAESLTFLCSIQDNAITGVPVQNKDDMSALLKDIPIGKIPVHFKCGKGASAILALYIIEAERRGLNQESMRGAVDSDPIGALIQRGSYPAGEDHSYEELKSVITYLHRCMPAFKGLTVHGERFAGSGASITQELAFSLASGVEYLDRFTSMGLSADQIAPRMSFSFSIGSDYFMEIAKLRAARMLWAVIMKQYKPKDESSEQISIETVTSGWNKTVYDPYTNMLRSTVEAMAATIGGSGTVHVSPLDSAFDAPGDFTRRMARNTQLILKNESYINRVIDPSAGSYYLETLTDSVAGAAWKLFLEVEQAGGIVEALKSGLIQDQIEKIGNSKESDLETGKMALLGVNRYPNLNEKAPAVIRGRADSAPLKRSENAEPDKIESIESLSEYLSKDGRYLADILPEEHTEPEFEVKPLIPWRAAEAFEELRITTENLIKDSNVGMTVFLLPLGNPAMRTARAGFSANFFGCGGFPVINPGAFDSAEEGIKTALESGSKIVVICSSDKEYPAIAPAICEKLKSADGNIRVIIAGNPREHIDELKESGVEDFIHVHSNMLQILRKYQKAVGIE